MFSQRPNGARMAVGLAVTAGFLAGLFLAACAEQPFGPVLFGWIVAFTGAVAVTAALCLLATGRYITVGVGYAAGVAAGAASVAAMADGMSGLLVAFGPVFPLMAASSLLASLPCSLIKWENSGILEVESRKHCRD